MSMAVEGQWATGYSALLAVDPPEAGAATARSAAAFHIGSVVAAAVYAETSCGRTKTVSTPEVQGCSRRSSITKWSLTSIAVRAKLIGVGA